MVYPSYLVLMDTDHIKGYIFATNRLKEIRGASLLLDKLNIQEARVLLIQYNGEEIFIGGGGVLATFPIKTAAQDYCIALQTAYCQQTRSATITGVIEEITSDADEEAALHRARSKLRLAKAARLRTQPLLSTPYARLCPSCNQNLVTVRVEEDEVCMVCSLKRQADTAIHYPDQVAQPIDTPFPQYSGYTKFAQRMVTLHDDSEWLKLDQLPAKLDQLEGKETDYIGFIHADVNGLGAFLEQQKSLAAIRSLGTKIEIALESALVDAVRQVGLTPHGRRWPFLIVIMGGDDLTLIVPARKALPLTNALCLWFEEHIREQLGIETRADKNLPCSKLALSAGVVIAKPAYPAYALADLADELTASAKRLSYSLNLQHGPVPTVDFQVVHAPTMNSLEQTRADEYSWSVGSTDYHYTARPYCCYAVNSTPALPALLNTVINLRQNDFPRNKLNQWTDLVYKQNDLEQILAWQTLQTRVTKQGRESLVEAIYDLNLTHRYLFIHPQTNADPFITPLLDLIELYDFVDVQSDQVISSPTRSQL